MNAPAALAAPAHADIWASLDPLTDPEIPVITLREMGILRDVREGADGVIEVVITPTYSGCPAMSQIEDDVRGALAAHGVPARVVTRLAPAWTTDWMSEVARKTARLRHCAAPVHPARRRGRRFSRGAFCQPLHGQPGNPMPALRLGGDH